MVGKDLLHTAIVEHLMDPISHPHDIVFDIIEKDIYIGRQKKNEDC